MNEVMVTDMYELTDNMCEMSRLDFKEEYLFDPRLRMAIPRKNLTSANMAMLYAQYLASFCELLNQHPDCRPGVLSACGYLPIGIESAALTGQINPHIIVPALEAKGITYYFQKQMSPISSEFERINESQGHDIWVNKLDAAKVVNKPAHNIRAVDLLEVIL